METPQTPVATKEFQVMGISRSGRVRKKSSKLLDFQSPDEVEKKLKRTVKTGRNGSRVRPSLANERGRRALDTSATDVDLNDAGMETGAKSGQFFERKARSTGLPTGDSDEDLKELVAGIVEGESLEGANTGESRVRQSLYMTEKANKRKILKDGKVVTGKLERKDKGKSRYTAYSLWARELRKTSKFSKNQDLDFSNTARRLGELWANVSNKEKSAWRRKAKIQATKAKAREKAVIASLSSGISCSFDKVKCRTTKKLAADHEESTAVTQIAKSNISKNCAGVEKIPASSTKRKRNNSHNKSTSASTAFSGDMSTGAIVNNIPVNIVGSGSSSLSATSFVSLAHKKFLLPSIEPIDAAAHLKLLGESLTIIGERLKEHEGQIAVSGSLSVLLDSLLCSLGPLLCLTTHIPGLEKKPHLSENLASTLDNIAYVMPGL